MERAPKVAVVPATFDWSDIGSWKAMSDLDDADGDGNRVRGQAVIVESANCYIQSEGRMVAAVGVRDLHGEPEDMVFALPKELRLRLVD